MMMIVSAAQANHNVVYDFFTEISLSFIESKKIGWDANFPTTLKTEHSQQPTSPSANQRDRCNE
jgi:hypothetical protein